MNNVIQFRPPRRQNAGDRLSILGKAFRECRRDPQDVFWLKENAEFLNILETQRPAVEPHVLRPYASFFQALPEQLRFFPQYYRFYLSLYLDLEDLGMSGAPGEGLCRWVLDQGFAEAELSDLQRAEARRLLSRRLSLLPDTSLEERLRAFANRSATFALPNKKAAYELTHIVFYLSEYGRIDPQLEPAAVVSLEYAGLLAYLEQNCDLLAEICVALRYAGQTPSAIWETWLAEVTSRFEVHDTSEHSVRDNYHEYLVINWWASVAGGSFFHTPVPENGARFQLQLQRPGPLREISQMLLHMGSTRCADWHRMRGSIQDAVGAENIEVLAAAEQSTDRFEEFFSSFARAGT